MDLGPPSLYIKEITYNLMPVQNYIKKGKKEGGGSKNHVH
jgi:hypothetical protein